MNYTLPVEVLDQKTLPIVMLEFNLEELLVTTGLLQQFMTVVHKLRFTEIMLFFSHFGMADGFKSYCTHAPWLPLQLRRIQLEA